MLQDYHGETPMRTPMPNISMYTPAPRTSLKASATHAGLENDGLIYGTTIMIKKAMAAVQKFLLEFERVKQVDGETVSEQIYRIKLNDLANEAFSPLFEIEGSHIKEFDRELYLQLIYYPAQMISCFDAVVRELFERYFIEPETDFNTKSTRQFRHSILMIGLKGLDEEQRICVKNLGPHHISRLILIRAMVIRVSETFPQMKKAWFRCDHCGDQVGVDMINARVQQPQNCRVCNKKQTMLIQHNLCSFTDKQYIKLQELPQFVQDGQTPSAITAIAYDSNVDGFRPGDRVEFIGIFRAQAVKVDKHRGQLRTLFNTYLDMISFSILGENRYGLQETVKLDDSEKHKFLRFSQSPQVIDNLVKSFAPSIYGHPSIKKGILAQLFSGTRKYVVGRGQTRSDINVCLIGDPSTAKSQMLQQVHRIAPRSIYTSGKGSSAVGLTAHVRRDPETRQFVLQSGALVLADQGICCIDQFDKMQQGSRLILLEAMEQQTISIAKAGIVCQLNSRTSILAAANPIDSKYDPKKSVIENINLPPSLLSRFDLIYILLDIADQKFDTMLARHILDFYVNGKTVTYESGPLKLNELTKYISYAREYVRPILTENAGKKLVEEYKSLRLKGMGNKTISVTPRQLQSLIRLSQAFAKMRLSNEVTQDDVEQAIQVMLNATMAAATDPETGIINLDIITTGKSAAVKKRTDEISKKLRDFLLANEAKYRKQTTMQRLYHEFQSVPEHKKLDINRDDLINAARVLQTEDLLAIYGQNKNNPNFKLQTDND